MNPKATLEVPLFSYGSSDLWESKHTTQTAGPRERDPSHPGGPEARVGGEFHGVRWTTETCLLMIQFYNNRFILALR